jgi:hypothetical protein
MHPRALLFVIPALLLLRFAWTLAGIRVPLPTGDEATPVMMVQSLWHDHDLAYRKADLARAERIWDGGPAGLTLFTSDGGRTLYFGRPLAYPLAVLPFYGLLGVRGIALFNMALFLAMAGAALWFFREESGLAGLFVVGFFFASATFAYAFRLESEVFSMACVFFSLLLWLRLRKTPEWQRKQLAALLGAGALVGALLVSSPLLAVLGLPIPLDLTVRRRFRGALAVLAGIFLMVGALALLQRAGTGEWTAFGGAQRRSFEAEFPLESHRDLWQGYGGEEEALDLAGGLLLLPRNLVYLLAGRYTGLVPYLPFALFALALSLVGWKERSHHLLLAALGVYVLGVLLVHPHAFDGGLDFVGSRWWARAYPAFLFLPRRLPVRRSLLLPYIAAGLWTAAAVAGSLSRLAPAGTLQIQNEAPAFRRLPLELTLLPGDRLPGFFVQTWGNAVWIEPRGSFFAEERRADGVWVRGSSRSEAIVVSPAPLSRLAFTVRSLASDNELLLDSGADRLRVRFDTEGKRAGTPVDLVVEPVARDLGFFPRDFFYRLTLETTGGLVPARRSPSSQDTRDLGVFLDFTAQGF